MESTVILDNAIACTYLQLFQRYKADQRVTHGTKEYFFYEEK